MLRSAPHSLSAPPDPSGQSIDADQDALALWARCHAELVAQGLERAPLVDVAVALVLGHLRACPTAQALVSRYQKSALDRALIERIVPTSVATWYEARDAAFYLRWRELAPNEARKPA
jgi:hypothetical protein